MIEIEMSMKPDPMSRLLSKAAGLFKPRGGEILSAHRFRQMLEPVKESLYNFIYKALNFSEDADDIYQESVLRAFKYRSGFRGGHPDGQQDGHNGAFKTWLFTIAHNQVKDYFNRHKKNTRHPEPEEHLQRASLPVEDERREQMLKDIYEVAALLPDKQRRVFFLHYDHRFSIKEIREITGLKEGNIKFILNRARNGIKEKLNGVNHDPR